MERLPFFDYLGEHCLVVAGVGLNVFHIRFTLNFLCGGFLIFFIFTFFCSYLFPFLFFSYFLKIADYYYHIVYVVWLLYN